MNIATYVLIGDLPRIPNDTQIGPNKSTPLVANGLVLIKRSAGKLPIICEANFGLYRKQFTHCLTTALHSRLAFMSHIGWRIRPTNALGPA